MAGDRASGVGGISSLQVAKSLQCSNVVSLVESCVFLAVALKNSSTET